VTQDGRDSRTHAYVTWLLRHGRLLWIVALVLAIPATARTVWLYAHLRSDLEELLPRQAPSVQAVHELHERLSGLQHLGVVVDAGDAKNVAAANRFLDDLAARVKRYPPELVRAVHLGTAEERAFLETHAVLYVDVPDLETIKRRIEARRDYEVARKLDWLLEEEAAEAPPPPLDFSDLKRKYEERLPKGGMTEDDRYASHKLARALMIIEVGEFSTGSSRDKDLLTRVQADVMALGTTAAYAPNMRVGYSGDVAVSVEELSGLVVDLSVSSALVLLAVVAVIVGYYRWWRSVLILLAPLVLAAVYSFALASLPPFGVTSLNSNTGFLGSIILGNGINFGIMMLARYVEERRRQSTVFDALVEGVRGARVGTMSAALAAGVAYASLTITQFRGFQQFGIVASIGMVMSWITAFVLIPPLVGWLDRDASTAPRPRKHADGLLMGPLGRLIVAAAWPIVIVAALLTVGAGWKAKGFNSDWLEHDFSQLRRADTWKNGDGYWSRKVDELLGVYITPIVILTDDVEQSRAIEDKLRQAAKEPGLSEYVASVRSLDDVLPRDQAAKIAIAKQIRNDITARMRSELEPDERSYLDRVLGQDGLQPIGADDLPRAFTLGLRERDGRLGSTVLVYPHLTGALWRGPSLTAFVAKLREVTASVPGREPARVAGSLPVSADLLSSTRHDGPIAVAAALIGVVGVVLLLFRWRRVSAWLIGSLCASVLWLLALTMLLGVKISFANFIAFPITFGIGIDYSVNIVSRYLQDGKKDVVAAVRNTGGAVALCSVTTIIGYSSLLVANSRALFLFGLVAVMGELACVLVGIVVLPAVLVLLDKRQARRAERLLPAP
jgi:uncharacterized protein